MQFTIRGLFAFVFACALLMGFVALPSDFQRVLVVLALVLLGVAFLLYTAFAPHVRAPYAAVVVLAWAAALAIVILLGSGGVWLP